MIRILSCLAFAGLMTGCASIPGFNPSNTHDRPPSLFDDPSPADIHVATFTLDTHIDVAQGYVSGELNAGDENDTQFDLPGMRQGGLDSGFFIVYVGQGTIDTIGYDEARQAAEADFAGNLATG